MTADVTIWEGLLIDDNERKGIEMSMQREIGIAFYMVGMRLAKKEYIQELLVRMKNDSTSENRDIQIYLGVFEAYLKLA